MNNNANLLIDRFGRKHEYLRISVTDQCNLRCTYCMPKEGMQWKNKSELLTNEEIIRLSKLFIRLGIKKIRITGGEPLLRHDIDELMTELSKLREPSNLETLALTTNATLLSPKLQFLRQMNLQLLNISLDTLHAERFIKITNQNKFDQVWHAINQAIKLDFHTLKLNVVVIVEFNDDEILDFADLAYKNKINIRFIEFMPFKNNNWQSQEVVPYTKIKEKIEQRYKLIPLECEPSAVAKDFAINDGQGSISFITSMTESFCASCNRLRLTADGFIKSCLFNPAEINLKDALAKNANDNDLYELIQQSLMLKPEAHPPAEEIAADHNRAMISIGG